MRAFLYVATILACAARAQAAGPTAGYVVRVDSHGVYLDLGAQAGASVGQAFEVYSEGDVLKHPVTGQSLGRLESKVSAGVIEQVEPLYSVGAVGDHAAVSAGMRARLIKP